MEYRRFQNIHSYEFRQPICILKRQSIWSCIRVMMIFPAEALWNTLILQWREPLTWLPIAVFLTSVYRLKRILDFWELDIRTEQDRQAQEMKRLHAAHRQLIFLATVSIYAVFALYSHIIHFVEK